MSDIEQPRIHSPPPRPQEHDIPRASYQEDSAAYSQQKIERSDAYNNADDAPKERFPVFVANLPYTCREEDLRAHFDRFGPVLEIRMINDRYTQEFKGCARIILESEKARTEALDEDGTDFGGRTLRVKVGNPEHGRGRYASLGKSLLTYRGGRGCFTCGEEGHFSRECPQSTRRDYGGRDAGRDAGRRDYERDSYRDSYRDAGRDSYRDSGRDYGRDSGRDSYRDSRRDYGDRDSGRDRYEPRSSRACYSCGESGHMSRDCPSGSSRYARRDDGYSQGDQGDRSRACYSCGEEGHMSRDCPKSRSY